MSESLTAYYAGIRALEDEWYPQLVQNGWVVGTSSWHGRLDRLREIDERHGIQSDDPRVYSIAAYQAERDEIAVEWKELGKANGWDAHDWEKPPPEGFVSAESRFGVRRSDCYARHFPGLDSLRLDTIDTIPKLWAHVTQHVILVKGWLDLSPLSRQPPEKRAYDKELVSVYGLLDKLKIPWAPRPPYPDLTPQEALNALTQIANRLERDDSERCQIGLARFAPTSAFGAVAPPAPASPTGGDVVVFDALLTALDRLTGFVTERHGDRAHSEFLELLTLDHEVAALCQVTRLALPPITYAGHYGDDFVGFCRIPVSRHTGGAYIWSDWGWHIALRGLRRTVELERDRRRKEAIPALRAPSFSPERLDPSQCPGCKAPVPEEYSTLPRVPCPTCGRWELHTGWLVSPVGGRPGTPPAVVRVASPFWQPRLPDRLVTDEGNEETKEARKVNVGKKRRRRGRPRDTDPAADRRIFDAWQTGQYKKYEDLAQELHISKLDVERAIDRHQKRLKRGSQ
jgi:hypothetical protein